MKFFTFKYQEREEIGILTKAEDQMIPINKINLSQTFSDMNDFIEFHKEKDINELKKIWNEEKKVDKYYNLDNIRILAPIPKPLHDIISIGVNYREHLEEVAKELNINNSTQMSPVIFTKRATYINGLDDIIPLHDDITQKLDYEVELGVIIKKTASKVKKSYVEDYIFGYTIMNDISARDLMTKHQQWTVGKGLDGTAVMGPCIVYKDYIQYPVNLNIFSKINGEIRQNSNTKKFIFDIDSLISNISRGITLMPGDIISTGTPSGVGMSYDPPKFLKDGDIIECQIEKIGVLKNVVQK